MERPISPSARASAEMPTGTAANTSTNRTVALCQIMINRPSDANAHILGTKDYPSIEGVARFFQTVGGVLAVIDVWGLPRSGKVCDRGVYGCHIHEGNRCSGNASDPLADVGEHYNPLGCPHPYHAGDMPPLFGNNGRAWMAFLNNSITISQLIGKTLVIHRNPDDMVSQPSGNSGPKIACGLIIHTLPG